MQYNFLGYRQINLQKNTLKIVKRKSTRTKGGKITVDQCAGLKQTPAQLPSTIPHCRGGTEYDSLAKSGKGQMWVYQ